MSLSTATGQVAILGAGPAGLSCALWLKHLGCTPVVLERSAVAGGILRDNVLLNDWVLGLPQLSGVEMAQRFVAHAQAVGIEPRLNTLVKRIHQCAGGFSLEFSGDDVPLNVSALVLAIGTRVCGNDWLATVPGADTVPTDRFIVGPAAFGSPERFTGKTLLVVGGGDNAHEFVRLTAERARHQYLLVRKYRRAQACQCTAVDALIKTGQVSLLQPAAIECLGWDGSMVHVDIGGRSLQVDALVIQIGYAPNVDHIVPALEPSLRHRLLRGNTGYLSTDEAGQTVVPGLYAIGDVANRENPCVVTALASGAVAARHIEKSLRDRHD